MKNIWIFNHYAGITYKEHGGRHYWIAKNLIRKGYNPTIFCANTLHNTNGEQIDLEGKKLQQKICDGISYVVVKTPNYVSNGIKRVKNMVAFFLALFPATKAYEKKYEKPDLILASSVHPLTCVAGIKIARRYKVPCIVEIRDLWPESILSYTKYKKNNFLIKLLFLLEKWIYVHADKIIFTMEGGKDYIIEKGWEEAIDLKKVFYINNGVDVEQFDYNKLHFQLDDKDLNNMEFFKVIYTGSIRQANHLEYLINVAERLKNEKIKILLYGKGIEATDLKRICKEKKLDNIIFKGSVEKKYIPFILSKGDLNILNYKYTNILKYGGSQNKLFEYASSGKPILSNCKMGYDLILKYRCGIVEKDNSEEQYAADILHLCYCKGMEEYVIMCKNARKMAYEFDFKKLTDKLIEVIES